MLAYVFWPLFCALLALAQGRLLPTLRTEAPDSPAARRNNFALHYLLAAAYFLPLLLAPATWLAAGLARALCFDLALNVATGSPLFYVGSTAASDRLLRRLAPAHPDRLRACLWLAVALAAAGFLLYYYKA